MNIRLLAMAVLTTGSCAFARNKFMEAPETVRVCVENAAGDSAVEGSELMARQIFHAAGVIVDFHNAIRPCREQADGTLVITLAPSAPKTAPPSALAQANVGDGVHIVVFDDRLATVDPRLHPVLLAHVLVHEITHIIEGVARHSETGIMKAFWTLADRDEMLRRSLLFAPEDVELIHVGLAARANHSEGILR